MLVLQMEKMIHLIVSASWVIHFTGFAQCKLGIKYCKGILSDGEI